MTYTALTIFLAGLPIAATPPTVLDNFGGTKGHAAESAWTVEKGTPPLIWTKSGQRLVLKVNAPFADNAKLKRATINRQRRLNLIVPTRFTLDIKVLSAEPSANITLYFRSGPGWFVASRSIEKAGWQTLTFSKDSFGSEGRPTGWQQIDGIRIAIWRDHQAAQNQSLLFRQLAAHRSDVALILPDSTSTAFRSTQQIADRIAKMLGSFGITSDQITESSLTLGSLGDRPLAILPHNPRLNKPSIDVLTKYVAAGGRMVVCYSLPSRLGVALGFRRGEYIQQKAPGDFASIHFESPRIAGLPRTVRQSSWNITTAIPTGHGARVIGTWSNKDGRPTGKAAWLLSNRGAYFSHILLNDDPAGTQDTLVAVLGSLHPPLWNTIARAVLQKSEQIGPYRSGAALNRNLLSGRLPASLAKELRAADADSQHAQRLLAQGHGYEANKSARRCRQRRATVYLRAQPSPKIEARAWWNHSGTGAYPGDWDRTCKELAAAGFNMIITNMARAGLAHYRSNVLPRSDLYDKYGDQISQCVAAAHKYGLEVHVWKVNFNLQRAPKEFVDTMRRAGRTQVSIDGKPIDWLNPAHPDNTRLELESLLEVVRNYNVDGIHFDYIRYPHRQADYSDYSRRKFEADTRQTVRHWPEDCYSGSLKQAYRDWRCKQITRLVAAVHREAKKLRPSIKISAAVFRSYPSCYETVGQDWPLWVRKGYLDFLCPMDYTDDDEKFVGWIQSQQKLVGGRIPIYPGIGATSARSTLTADRVVGQVQWTRTLRTGGFTVFNLSEETARRIFPGFHAGAGRNRATPPHRANR